MDSDSFDSDFGHRPQDSLPDFLGHRPFYGPELRYVSEAGREKLWYEPNIPCWLREVTPGAYEKRVAVQWLVQNFCGSMEDFWGMHPANFKIFGMDHCDFEPQVYGRLSVMVRSAWSELMTNHNLCIRKMTKAILRGQLPGRFRKWVEKAGQSRNADRSSRVCKNLLKRNAWGSLAWDYQSLYALAVDQSECPSDLSINQKEMQVVWIHAPADPYADATCTSAPKEGPVHTQLVTWGLVQTLIAKNGWVELPCPFVEHRLHEDIILFAAPSQRYYSMETLKGCENVAARYLTADKLLLDLSTIYGTALLVRRNGGDLQHTSAARLCQFMEAVYGKFVELGVGRSGDFDEPGLQAYLEQLAHKNFLSRAISSWPKYQLGMEIRACGGLDETPEYKPYRAYWTRIGLDVQKGTNPPLQMDGKDVCGDRTRTRTAEVAVASDNLILVLLRFSRNPSILHERLQARMADLGFKWRLTSGAYMFVPEEMNDAVRAHIMEKDLQLGPGHVVVAEQLEEMVMEAITSLPRKYKINVESRETFIVENKPAEFAEDIVAEDQSPTTCGIEREIIITVERTFVHIRLPTSLCSELSGGPRTASTSDAAPTAYPNPRSFLKRNV